MRYEKESHIFWMKESVLTIRNGEDIVSPIALFSEISLDCNNSEAKLDANATSRYQNKGRLVKEDDASLEWMCNACHRFRCRHLVIADENEKR